MDWRLFRGLCDFAKETVGAEVFKSKSDGLSNAFVSGEKKTAISLCMLAGGSCLDHGPLFTVSVSGLHKTFTEFIEWTLLLTFQFPLVPWLREGRVDVLSHFARQFGEKSGGAFCGAFGALDGVAIRIRSPKLTEVPHPGNCHCRKGFHALNVQAT